MRAVLPLVLFTLLAGCSSPHLITLQDGTHIQTVDEPDFNEDTGFYEYETESGDEESVNKNTVKKIREL
ncbi:YgdI/YgdR family lipoprotein [Zooshikella marina]|uniref:YgdI/YgdR family lipoprotein n=1 Tax=Zooshikella ganghwensis TaxID=202772 RepID=A0A4P9VRE4_9GAMM|nr:YgdI/YgdR family lipoprotein [Zooshikella ganghwensis]MBU2707637.1 YgdI/YgdR family lipoprotein [Zooshikella ganghwensis]RDH44702.1 YgdI/YgdR family lipoprotein [Zooshikella ganghwensis]